VDNLSKLGSPLIHKHNSQQELIGSESTYRTTNRQNKATVSRDSEFFMVNIDTDSLTNSKTNQLSKKDSNQLYGKHAKNDDMKTQLIIYHQNMRGLKGKINEFVLSLPAEAPHLICFTEHHLKDYEMANKHISTCKLGTTYCRKKLKQGGICIYVHESLKFTNINVLKYSKHQDIEIAAIQLNFATGKL
jgi:hypothetical protein